MKTTLKLIALSTFMFGSLLEGSSQVYQYSHTQALNDVYAVLNDDSQPSYYVGWWTTPNISFRSGTLNETIVIDQAAGTIRRYGTLQFAPWTSSRKVSTSRSATETVMVTPPIFPNPPVYETVTKSADFEVTLSYDGGSASFDTGVHPISWNGNQWGYDGYTVYASVNLAGTHSIFADGQTVTGTAAGSISFALFSADWVNPYYQSFTPYLSWFRVGLENYPTDLSAGHFYVTGRGSGGSYTAPNGLSASLYISEVPEPSAAAILLLGFAAICGRKKLNS